MIGLPARHKPFSEVLGPRGDPGADFFRWEPFAAVDLFRQRFHGAIVMGEVEFDELEIGVRASRELSGEFGGFDADADFFKGLANGAGGVAFANVEMARGAAVPLER